MLDSTQNYNFRTRCCLRFRLRISTLMGFSRTQIVTCKLYGPVRPNTVNTRGPPGPLKLSTIFLFLRSSSPGETPAPVEIFCWVGRGPHAQRALTREASLSHQESRKHRSRSSPSHDLKSRTLERAYAHCRRPQEKVAVHKCLGKLCNPC